MKFNLTLKAKAISEARDKVLLKLATRTHLKGFRKGKAPIKMVEEYVGSQAITEGILDALLPKAYADHVNAEKLAPLASPKITPTSVKDGEDWLFEVEIAQKPPVTLGNYKTYIKSALKSVYKTKKDAQSGDKSKNPDEDPELVAIFDALLKNAKCDVPELLVEEEVNNQLSKLVSQLQRLGLSLEQYVASIKSDVKTIRENYRKSATDNLILEFILADLVKDLKIEVSEKEIDDLIATVGDEHAQEHLRTPRERAGIRHMLAKRQVVDRLKALK